MSPNPQPANDITWDTEHDVLFCDSHQVKHNQVDKMHFPSVSC